MADEHRRARRAAGAVATIVVALAGGFGLLLFFVARDDAPVEEHQATTTTQAAGPGEATADPGARHLPAARRAELLRALEAGNVVLVYGAPRPPAALAALADDVTGGPYDPALARAGQAVILVRRPGTRGVVALAHRRVLRAPSAADPELRRFAEAWLGRGAGG
jgi:hypothetical protein